MKCNFCGATNPEGTAFCQQCGSPLKVAEAGGQPQQANPQATNLQNPQMQQGTMQTPMQNGMNVPNGTMVVKKPFNLFGCLGMVCGIVSLLLSFVACYTSLFTCVWVIIAWIVSIAAVALSIVGLVLKNKARGMAIAGLVLGCVSLVFVLAATVTWVTVGSVVGSKISRASSAISSLSSYL